MSRLVVCQAALNGMRRNRLALAVAVALAATACASADPGTSTEAQTAAGYAAWGPSAGTDFAAAGTAASLPPAGETGEAGTGPLPVPDSGLTTDAPDSGAPSDADAATTPMPMIDAALLPAEEPSCITGASQGFIVGDSYVTGFASPALQPELAKIKPILGQLKNYAGAGCSMVSGGACTGFYGNVPQQLSTAITEHPGAKFAIIDGGGNDVLLCDTLKYPGCNTTCSKPGASKQKVCTDIVQTAISAADDLIQKAATAGVRDIVYFFYPHVPAANGGYNEVLDYALPLARAACEGAEAKSGGKTRCYFVDLVEPFRAAFGDAAPAQFEAVVSIHPLQAGVTLMAKEITKVMAANCLGEQSGCCAP